MFDYTTTQTHKHTNTQTHKHTNTQTHKHTNTQTHKHTNTHAHTRPDTMGSGGQDTAFDNVAGASREIGKTGDPTTKDDRREILHGATKGAEAQG